MKVISSKGKEVDMGRLMAQNENAIALGNASMNARGDRISGGKVVVRREQIARDYYSVNPKAVKQVSLRDLAAETTFASPADAVAALTAPATAKVATKPAEAPRKPRKIEERDD